MNNDLMHLAQITLAQLKEIKSPTGSEIMKAVVYAVEKEEAMSQQLYKSFLGDRKLFDAFQHEISGLVYDEVNK